jgi:hypothetical protein
MSELLVTDDQREAERAKARTVAQFGATAAK